MPDALEEFASRDHRRTPQELPAEERLKGLPAEERLKGLPAEERVKGLSLDELLAALPSEVRVALAQRLRAEGTPPPPEGGQAGQDEAKH